MKITHKFTLAFLAVGSIVLALASFTFYYQFKESLIERTLEQLSSVNILKKSAIERLIQQNTNTSGFNIDEIICSDTILMSNIQRILLERTGLGETGESYLVGPDYKMRSVSRFFPDKTPNDIEVFNKGVASVLKGNEGKALLKDYRGVLVLSIYRKINIDELNWVILSEIDEAEVVKPVEKMKSKLILISAIYFAFVIIMAIIISRIIVTPIAILKRVVLQLAQGKLPTDPLPQRGQDEIGEMSVAIQELLISVEKSIVFANKVGEGDFNSEHHLLSNEDALGKALVSMRNRLKELVEKNKILSWESKVALIQGQEEERIRFSKDIHDGAGPLLTSIKFRISALSIDASEKQKIMELIDETISEMRRISYNLVPPVLIDFGVGPAINNLVQSLSKSVNCNITFIDDTNKNSTKLDKTLNLALYRIIQEALNNVFKHSCATSVKVSITEFPDKVSLYIHDNGSGFVLNNIETNNNSGNGLKNMRERVSLLNGDFFINSNNRGTTIEVEIPFKNV